MADNVNLTAGDGSIIAGADVIAGVAYPRAKVVWGPDGTVNDTDVASGKPLPVQLRSATGSAITPISPDVGSGTGGSATQRVLVDSSQLSVLGSAVSASSAPVVIASDQTAVAVKGSGTAGTANSGVVTVQGIASMTKLLVTPDSVALPANQSVNIAQIAGATTPVGSGVMATAPRVALATDSPGIVALGQTTASASVPVVMASDYVTALPVGYSFSHISTSTTTTVKSGAGVLHTLTVNNLGTVSSTTTVYNNTAASGTVIAIINTLAGQISYVYDIAFSTGLTIVTTGTVAPDITVSYR